MYHFSTYSIRNSIREKQTYPATLFSYCTKVDFFSMIENKYSTILTAGGLALKKELSIEQIAVAIYTINRHAKTATDNKELYRLKKTAIQQLIEEGHAQKVGLHFTDHPKLSKQHSTLLVRCGEFLFHTLPEKEDFDTVPHLGRRDVSRRNPQQRMNLKTAKEIIYKYTQTSPPLKPKKAMRKTSNPKHQQGFRSSYLDGN